MKRGKVRQLRELIERLAVTLDDETALTGVELFPVWAILPYTVGDRVQYSGKLYKCLTAHTAQADWTPTTAPSLWAEILAGQGGTAIGEWVQPDSTNPYMLGDRVRYSGKTYQSTVDGNVWAPWGYGWIEVSD